jgi:predicted solute-binding protein
MDYMGKSLRSQLYRAARDLGTAEAAAKGPVPLGKRVVRRRIYRKTNGLLARLLKRGGL